MGRNAAAEVPRLNCRSAKPDDQHNQDECAEKLFPMGKDDFQPWNVEVVWSKVLAAEIAIKNARAG